MSGFERDKLLEATAYFAGKVRNLGWVKLLKLLYYLDLIHFRQTGRTVTGLKYTAWEMGPVADSLYDELKDEHSDFRENFDVSRWREIEDEGDAPTIDSLEEDLELRRPPGRYKIPGIVKPRHPLQPRHLSRRELTIADELIEVFRDAAADQMSMVSHGRHGPWETARMRGRDQGLDRPPIDLLEGDPETGDESKFIPKDELRELVAERAQEREALR